MPVDVGIGLTRVAVEEMVDVAVVADREGAVHCSAGVLVEG